MRKNIVSAGSIKTTCFLPPLKTNDLRSGIKETHGHSKDAGLQIVVDDSGSLDTTNNIRDIADHHIHDQISRYQQSVSAQEERDRTLVFALICRDPVSEPKVSGDLTALTETVHKQTKDGFVVGTSVVIQERKCWTAFRS